jgi:hypothetical protein
MEKEKKVMIGISYQLSVEFDTLAKELNMKRTELINYLIKFYKEKR